MSSSSKELSKFEKEKQKLVQEKCQGMLNEMLRDDDNKYCVDCDAKGPRWASWNLGIFLCIRCAGIHRNLGVHISRVKSVNLDSWTPEQVVTMQQMGNSRARAVYEANLPDNFRRPQTDVALENFIRAKYEHTKYIAQEWVKPPPVRVDWNAEIEEQIRRKKEKKNAEAAAIIPKLGNSKINSHTSPSVKPHRTVAQPLGKIEIPKPAPTPPPPAETVAPPPVVSNPSDDLLGLSNPTDPFASPIKSTNVEDELGGVFTSDANSQLKMTKESILSLYGNAPNSTFGNMMGNNPMVNTQNQVNPMNALGNPLGNTLVNPLGNPLANPMNTNPMGANTMNTNPMNNAFGNPMPGNGTFNPIAGNGTFNPIAANNPFAAGFGAPNAPLNNQFQNQGQGVFDLVGNGFAGGGGSSNVAQLQQGVFSLNLGGSAGGVSQPSNLMSNVGGGGFSQNAGLLSHNHQGSLGIFQNGGGATTGGATNTNNTNLDLLWK
ncbi:unnamed protein product [Orchesella dallaii]|uniref:Arf-GAP domain-containing protein n=1 Tax=Orchesella dallaii TaxID=48710 RepID=A0ABP1PRJ5_9HEXA